MNEQTRNLLKNTNAYKIIVGDKKRGTLSHAYLVVCPDGILLREYMREFARLFLCERGDGCGKCRACALVEKERYADCDFYPAEGERLKVADIDDLIPKTIVKPLENDLRLFVLCGGENMTAEAQNKILKTLEEPPANAHILIGATADYNLLSTVKSRVKRLEIPPFTDAEIRRALGDDFTDKERLEAAITLGGGKIGETIKAYSDDRAIETKRLCEDVLFKMKSSKDAARYSARITKDNVKDVVAILKSRINAMMTRDFDKARESGYTLGALVAITDYLTEKERALFFNANPTMVGDGILLAILGEKYKWQKL